MRLKMSKIELRNVKGTTDYSPKEQYIRYWSGRYRNKPKDQQEIINCCYDMFKTGLISIEEMMDLVNKSKDRKSEKEKIIKCLTQKVYFDINNAEEEDI